MAYDTKVILSSLAQNIAKSETVEEAYMAVIESANVEGVQIPSYEEAIKKISTLRSKQCKN